MATFACLSAPGFAFVLEYETEGIKEWLVGSLFTCRPKNMNITTRGIEMTSTTAANIDKVKVLDIQDQIVKLRWP
jgi:hypothetical protein